MLINSLFQGAFSILLAVPARKARQRLQSAQAPKSGVDSQLQADGGDLSTAGVLEAVERALRLSVDDAETR